MTAKFDLDGLGLSFGEAGRIEGEVELDPVVLGGQSYRPDPPETPFRIDVSRTSTGHALRLRLATGLAGPCFRCLEPAVAEVEVDAREVDQPQFEGSGEGDDADGTATEDGASPYLDDGILDLDAWARDALILALPERILCRDDCQGLCPVCGERLADSGPGAHDHGEAGDPRWAKLKELG